MLIAPTALLATFALVSGPAFAGSGTGDATITECPAPNSPAVASHVDTVTQAAEEAAAAAEDLADGSCTSAEAGQAQTALKAALARLSVPGAGGNGVAAAVLQALIHGTSPAGIGATHGAAMAKAAQDRRADHAHGAGKPDTAAATEAAAPDTPEVPDTPEAPETPEAPVTKATPATPAKPATPATADTPADPATPAVPAAPIHPTTPEAPAAADGHGRPSGTGHG